MKKTSLTVLVLAGTAVWQAMASTVLPSQTKGWQCSTVNGTTWQTGQARFRSADYSVVNTPWAMDMPIRVKHTFDLSRFDPGSAQYSMGIDHNLDVCRKSGFVTHIVDENYASLGDSTGDLIGALPGINEVELTLIDGGGLGFFDMGTTANRIPEPSTSLVGIAMSLILLGTIVRSRRRQPPPRNTKPDRARAIAG
jgi:hypothetical protein